MLIYPELRDVRDERCWERVWRDKPGFFFPGCKCCATEAYMYSLGGSTNVSFPNAVVTADKTAMTSATTSAVSGANLSTARSQHVTIGNPGVAGYSTGGTANLTGTTVMSSTDKTDTSTDTTSACGTATLSQARKESASFSERSTKGYVIAGGIFSAGILTAQQTADVFTFSSETFSATTSAKVATAVNGPSGMNANTSKGYVAGGFTGSPATTDVTTGYVTTFSSDTTTATGTSNLTVKRHFMFSGSDGSSKGYYVGGTGSGIPSTQVDKITVSTDTTSSVGSGTWSSTRNGGGSSGSDGTIFVGLSGTTTDASGQKITFSTDAITAFGSGSAGNLSIARIALAGFSTVAL